MKKDHYDRIKQGKNNRASGKRFELKVREDLEKRGWIVFRNSNDVKALPLGHEFKQTTGHWNPFTKSIMMNQSGFPDFICIKNKNYVVSDWEVNFVECKGGDEKHKYLDKKEKEKVEWIKNNLKIPVLVARKGEKRGEIVYE